MKKFWLQNLITFKFKPPIFCLTEVLLTFLPIVQKEEELAIRSAFTFLNTAISINDETGSLLYNYVGVVQKKRPQYLKSQTA